MRLAGDGRAGSDIETESTEDTYVSYRSILSEMAPLHEEFAQCSRAVIELDALIEENRVCQSDVECSVQFVGVCPFGCDLAAGGCQYECNAHEYEAVCIANRCELRDAETGDPQRNSD